MVAVTDCISAGIGHTQLNEFCASLDMPENDKELMKEARLALEREDIEITMLHLGWDLVTNSDTLERFRNAIIKAVEYRSGTIMDLPWDQRITLLREDTRNGPKHILGYHDGCADYFCSKNTSE
ncbi:hypothetical protein ILUMI_06150, partial [Ignelater luminosus]